MRPIAGAVLTGGESRRMGRDKATLEVAGVPLAVRVARALLEVGVSPVVAIGGPIEQLGAAGLDGIADRWPGQGPLGGLLTALRWSPAPRVLVAACDLPGLTADAAREVLIDDDPAAHVVMAVTDRPEPLFAVWDVARATAELQAAFDAGERSPRRAIRGLVVRRVTLRMPETLRDADEPGDLPSV